MGGWTYILTNKPCGVLYVGVTAELAARIMQHRAGTGSAFCRRYGLKRLVLADRHDRIEDAIMREKALKAWKRGLEDRADRGCEPFVGRSVRGHPLAAGDPSFRWGDDRGDG